MPSTNNLQVLPDDVILSITPFLAQPDALNLSLVSKRLRPFSLLQAFLCSITLSLNATHITRFCTHMLVDFPAYLPYIQNLQVRLSYTACEMSYICPSTLGLAPCAQLLFRTENLRELQIYKLEGLLQHEPRYGDAILALKHLVSVKFTGAGPLALNLISRLSSSVRNVVLFLEPGTMTWHDLLSQFRPTPNVQKLELCHVRWLPSEEDVFSGPLPQPRKGDGITACWPNVRTLNLLRGAVPMHICARVFPGLRNLAVSEKSLWTTSCDNSNWQVLDRVSTIPRSLLPTTIRSVHHLRLLLVEYTENLLLSIEKVSPAILSLRSDSAIDHSFWTSLMQRAPNLRCLDVVVECDSERQETPEDYLLWLLDLANALAATRVMCVRIRFNKAEGWDVAPLRAHLSRFIATAKPVRYLSAECGSVVFRGHEDDLCGWRRWWRAQNTPGGRVLKDMSFEVGEELLEKLCDARLFKTMDLDEPMDKGN